MLPHSKYLNLLLSAILFIVSACADKDTTVAVSYPLVKSGAVFITESGQLESRNNILIKAPGDWQMEYQIARLPQEGSFVEAGDTVVFFNTGSARSKLEEALAEIELQQEKFQETKRQNEIDLRQVQDNILQLEWQLKIDLSTVEQSRFESDVRLRQAELDLKKTQLRLKKARDNLISQKVINGRKLDLVKIAIRQAKVKIARARNVMAQMFLIARRGGMVIYKSPGWGSNEKVRIGDTVWPQSSILAIPDLDSMQVLIKLNEVDRALIAKGQKCNISIDAYPDTLFQGKIQDISEIISTAEGARNLKTYDVIAGLPSGVNYRLKPGLSARVRIRIKNHTDVYRVPEWCLDQQNDDYFVHTAHGQKIKVDLAELRDGRAFIRGKLSADMRLLPVLQF